VKTKLQIERERQHHARLDAMAGKCSERSEAGASHLGCQYCAYLADFYARQRDAANGINR
jgi:hypothetical protein